MDTISSGEYYYNDIDVSSLRRNELHQFRKQHIGFVFQHFELLDNYTVFENVEIPLIARNVKKNLRRKKVLKYLSLTGIAELKDKLPTQLSGGQQQRCAIARALACETNIIIADEPTGALDATTSNEIMLLLRAFNEDGKTIIIVTHDMGIAQQCGRIIEIADGKIV